MPRPPSHKYLLASLLLLITSPRLAGRAQALEIGCTTKQECQHAVGRASECRAGVCTNPYETGCLHSHPLLSDSSQKRVCNSEDPQDAAERGICRVPDIQHDEIRIFSQNWESAMYEASLLQLLLSELLDVPATIETGTPNATMNFYDEYGAFEYGTSNDLLSLENAMQLDQDCTSANRDRFGDKYQSCSHIVPEVWDTSLNTVQEWIREGFIEQPQPLGVLGQEGWFVPKFTAERDPSVTNYLGLQGDENRQKLANLFRRPTTWAEYCELISENNCQSPDEYSKRAPFDEWEGERMFVDGLFRGYFRDTEANNCTLTGNCTGALIDYPCGWSSSSEAQAYHLDLPLETYKYTYGQMVDMWHAANETKSNIMMMWWSPDLMYQTFQGTDAEFVRVSLPAPTQECMENRLRPGARCEEDLATRVGSPLGVCDEPPKPLKKIFLKDLFVKIHSVPEAVRSPAYDVIKSFEISELQLSEIFHLAKTMPPRDALCHWAVDHIDYMKGFIPRNHPRVLEEEDIHERPLFYTAMVLGSVAVLVVILTSCFVYRQRERRIMRFAQVEFLWLLLTGAFMVAIGALLVSSAPVNAKCVAEVWLINIGYTLVLVPLIVKIAAINKLLNAARKMRRIVLPRVALFGAVATICLFVIVFLIIWTVLDPPQKLPEYELTDEMTPSGESIVQVSYYCASESISWGYVSVGWNAVLLFCATVLAIQSRKSQQEFNESQVLGNLIYSHFVFVLLRIITTFVSIEGATLMQIQSILFSLDTMATSAIYFLPKLLAKDVRRQSVHVYSSDLSQSHRPPNDKAQDDGSAPCPNGIRAILAHLLRLSEARVEEVSHEDSGAMMEEGGSGVSTAAQPGASVPKSAGSDMVSDKGSGSITAGASSNFGVDVDNGTTVEELRMPIEKQNGSGFGHGIRSFTIGTTRTCGAEAEHGTTVEELRMTIEKQNILIEALRSLLVDMPEGMQLPGDSSTSSGEQSS